MYCWAWTQKPNKQTSKHSKEIVLKIPVCEKEVCVYYHHLLDVAAEEKNSQAVWADPFFGRKEDEDFLLFVINFFEFSVDIWGISLCVVC